MKKTWVLTEELFEELLAWLDSDREVAGQKYEDIRRGLIKIFTIHGCHSVEDLADETINRVTSKLSQIADSFEGNPSHYFYGVAKKIVHEDRRRPPVQMEMPNWESDDVEAEYECLEKCLNKLTRENRELVLQYYQEEKKEKIENRRKLAERLGIALNALRIRAHRIRNSLESCVHECLLSFTSEMN